MTKHTISKPLFVENGGVRNLKTSARMCVFGNNTVSQSDDTVRELFSTSLRTVWAMFFAIFIFQNVLVAQPPKNYLPYPTGDELPNHTLQPYSLKDSTPFINTSNLINNQLPKYSRNQLLAPGILLGAGIGLDLFKGAKNTQLSIHRNQFRDFHTAADNFLLYAPMAFPYGLDLIGIPSKNSIANRTAIFVKGEILAVASGFLLKHSIHEWRPDRSNRFSFPSGHALQAFATATMLSEEYGYKSRWVPYVSYGIASIVGILRVANNKHYLGDVFSGAAIGILTMKLSYWTHGYKWKRRSKLRER